MTSIVTYPAPAGVVLNIDYTVRIRKPGGTWSTLDAYNVKADSDMVQNSSDVDPVVDSPMVYFDFSDGPIEISIIKNNGDIQNAAVHPLALNIELKYVQENEITFILEMPKKIAVEINGVKRGSVLIFASPIETDFPDPTDARVKYFKAGVTKLPFVGAETWKGNIKHVSIYNRTLSSIEIHELYSQRKVPGCQHCWPLENNARDIVGGMHGELINNPSFSPDPVDEISSLKLNGFGDVVEVESGFDPAVPCFSISAWVYPDEAKEHARCTIIGQSDGVSWIYREQDGRIATDLNNFEFPHKSNKTISAGKWHHIALVKNNDYLTFYINGEEAGTCDTGKRPIKPCSGRLLIGGSSVKRGIYLKDDETMYIAGGAVLQGQVFITASKAVKIAGRGMIDLSSFPYPEVYTCGFNFYRGISIEYSGNVTIDGIIINDSKEFCMNITQSQDVNIENLKILSRFQWCDGIDMQSSSQIKVNNSFIRSNDDCIAIYASRFSSCGGCSNISVSNSTLWPTNAHAIMTGASAKPYGNDIIQGLVFENIDIIECSCMYEEYQGTMALNAGNDATIENVVFDGIRIQDIELNQLFNIRVFYNEQYNITPGKTIRNIHFRNISYHGRNTLPAQIYGFNGDRGIKGVTFEKLVINDEAVLTTNDANLAVGPYTENVRVQTTMP